MLRTMSWVSVQRFWSIGLYAFFLVMLTGFVAFMHGGQTMPRADGVPLDATRQAMIAHFGGSDYGSYARGAGVLLEEGLRAYANQGYKNWAPGVSFLEMMLSWPAPDAPLPFLMLIVAILLWAWALMVFSNLLRDIWGLSRIGSIAVPLTIFIAPFFYNALIWDGVLLSEALSMPLFLVGAMAVARIYLSGIVPRRLRLVGIGATFVAAAFVRAQFDVVFINFVLMFGALHVVYFFVRKCKKSSADFIRWDVRRAFLIIIGVYAALTIPYRMTIHSTFVATNNYVWKLIWHDRPFFESTGGGFIADGGGHVMCLANPEKCAEFVALEKAGTPAHSGITAKAALKTVLLNPVTFLSLKLPYLYLSWLDDYLSCHDHGSCTPQTVNKPMLFLFPLVFVYLMVCGQKGKRLRRVAEMGFVLWGVTFGALAFSLFIHVEPRYMLLIKVFMFWTEAALVGIILDKLVWRYVSARGEGAVQTPSSSSSLSHMAK